MPRYDYQHLNTPCELGEIFEIIQSIHDTPLQRCPHCQGLVQKYISNIYVNTPRTNTNYKDLGFTKLVKRDDGVYENVTRRGNDSRYMIAGQPDTLPDLSKTIS